MWYLYLLNFLIFFENRRIAEEWDKLDQHIIDKTVEEWRKRLRACVAAGGGQFEQKMWTFIISDILYRFSGQIFLKYCCIVQ